MRLCINEEEYEEIAWNYDAATFQLPHQFKMEKIDKLKTILQSGINAYVTKKNS